MADKFANYLAMDPESTNKENTRHNEGKLSSFDAMKKTSWNHQQLQQYLSASGLDHNLKKPAPVASWSSSVLFNKYANIGSQDAHNATLGLSSIGHVYNPSSSLNNEMKYGTASILTNSSISGTQSIDLPLQSTLGNNSTAASKAILALQDKWKILERENGFLRELVATSEQRSKHFEGVQHELENIKIQHQNELQQCFGREKDLENKLFNLEHEHKQMAQYAEAWNERITMLESSFNHLPSDKDTMHSYKSSDFQVDPDNYSNLVDKLEEYEQMIFDLENQRNESLTEVEQMKSRIQNFSENMKSSKTNTKSNSSHNNELEDKVKKAIKEAKKLKDQLFKQKKDYETKHNNFKRRHKLDIEGYKQESQLKEKDIERQKKEIEKLRRKVGRNEIDSSQIVKAVVKHNFNSKKPSVNIVNSARKVNNIWKWDDENNYPPLRKVKARGLSSRRSKSRDRTSDSWSRKNQHLISARGKRSSRSRSRHKSSGIPLHRNKSVSKVSNDGSRKQLIVNLEWPAKWNQDDNSSIDHNMSRSMSNEKPYAEATVSNLILYNYRMIVKFIAQ
jgi:hypothetical protein